MAVRIIEYAHSLVKAKELRDVKLLVEKTLYVLLLPPLVVAAAASSSACCYLSKVLRVCVVEQSMKLVQSVEAGCISVCVSVWGLDEPSSHPVLQLGCGNSHMDFATIWPLTGVVTCMLTSWLVYNC